MIKNGIVNSVAILALIAGCQSNNDRFHASLNDPDSPKVARLGLLESHAETSSNIPIIITSAMRELGISFSEKQLSKGHFEYHAEIATGERIAIKAKFLTEGRRIYIRVWGEDTSATELRTQLVDAINAGIEDDMRALGILKDRPGAVTSTL